MRSLRRYDAVVAALWCDFYCDLQSHHNYGQMRMRTRPQLQYCGLMRTRPQPQYCGRITWRGPQFKTIVVAFNITLACLSSSSSSDSCHALACFLWRFHLSVYPSKYLDNHYWSVLTFSYHNIIFCLLCFISMSILYRIISSFGGIFSFVKKISLHHLGSLHLAPLSHLEVHFLSLNFFGFDNFTLWL